MSVATLESSAAPVSDHFDLEELFLFAVALGGGKFDVRLDEQALSGRAQEIAGALNRFASRMQQLTSEVTRVSNEVAHGVLGGSVDVLIPPGPWKQTVDAFNEMQWAITGQLRDFAKSARLAAQGDASRKVTVPCEGETLELKNAMNGMLDRLRAQGQTQAKTQS